jgi:cell division septum initiation protein DivIVA
MFNKQEQEAYLGLIDRHIEELQKRINSLKDRISVMQAEGHDKQPQAQLLANMLGVMQSLSVIRAEASKSRSPSDERIHPGPHD